MTLNKQTEYSNKNKPNVNERNTNKETRTKHKQKTQTKQNIQERNIQDTKGIKGTKIKKQNINFTSREQIELPRKRNTSNQRKYGQRTTNGNVAINIQQRN